MKFKKSGLKVWIPTLIVGITFGLLLAVRLNILSLSKAQEQAEFEIKSAGSVNAQALENSFVWVAKEVGPAVVSISTEHTQKMPRETAHLFKHITANAQLFQKK